MGKVKLGFKAKKITNFMYQFPMGKVKRVRAAQLTIQSYVSIPYGKGKALKDPEGAVVHSYQFPMGKVKKIGTGFFKPFAALSINSLWER